MSIQNSRLDSGEATLKVHQNKTIRQNNVLGPAPLQKRWSRLFRSPLWLCLLIALIVRVVLVLHTNGFIDGDEALVGIQAQHILRGELPIYFYNQSYMGSLEAYLVALLFAVAGSSVWTLRAEPILLSLVAVCLTWKFASLLAEEAQLSQRATHWFKVIAPLLAAVPPLYDTVLELRTLGGYIEIFLLMLLLLISVLQLTRRYAGARVVPPKLVPAPASTRELAWRWAGIGFIIGLSFWVNPLFICALLAAVLWLLGSFIRCWRQRASIRLAGLLLAPLAGLPACLLGMAPAIYWGAMNSWQNFTYLIQIGANTSLRPEVQAAYPTRKAILFGLVNLYTTCISPRVISGTLPGESSVLAFLHTPALFLGVFCILTTIVLVAVSFAWHHPLLLQIRRLAGLPLLFGTCSALIFCTTTTAAIGLWQCQYDLAGRYATPLMLALPFFFAAPFAFLISLEEHLQEKRNVGAGLAPARFTSTRQFIRMPLAGDAVGSWENVPSRSSRLPLRTLALKVTLGLLLGVLLVTLYMQARTYGLTDPAYTFQSPYCVNAPVNDDPIIAYMEQQHISSVWTNNWVAYPLIFKTQGKIIASDPLPIIRHIPTLDRIPAYTNALRHADRPSLVVLVKHNDRSPALLKLLNKEHVVYRVARFNSVPGIDLLVVTPVSRTVSPFEPGNFHDIFFCSRDG